MAEQYKTASEVLPWNNERMFDDTSHKYRQEHWFDTSLRSPYVYDITHKRLLEALALTGQEDVFEMGCGPGTWTRVIAAHARSVTVVELSRRMIDRAQEYVRPYTVNFIHSDILSFTPERVYDRVVSLRAIEYIPDQETLTKRLTGMVADNGVLVIVSKTPFSAWRGRRVVGRLRAMFLRRRPAAAQAVSTNQEGADSSSYFMRRVSPWQLARRVREAGFEDVILRPVIVGLPILMGAHDEGSDLPLVPASLAPAVLRAFNWIGDRVAVAPQWMMPVILPFSESYMVRARKAESAGTPKRRGATKRAVSARAGAITLTVFGLALVGAFLAKWTRGVQ